MNLETFGVSQCLTGFVHRESEGGRSSARYLQSLLPIGDMAHNQCLLTPAASLAARHASPQSVGASSMGTTNHGACSPPTKPA